MSAPCSHILNEALQTDLIPPPRKMLNQPNTNMTKYCKYHRNNGHTTNDCKAWQDKIEELIWAGHLMRFLKREGDESLFPSIPLAFMYPFDSCKVLYCLFLVHFP